MLHIIKQSPFASDNLEKCLNLIQANDAILLIENAVTAGVNKNKLSLKIVSISSTCFLYALKPDVIARGLQDNMMLEINLIDYEQFVDLVIEHHPVQTWN